MQAPSASSSSASILSLDSGLSITTCVSTFSVSPSVMYPRSRIVPRFVLKNTRCSSRNEITSIFRAVKMSVRCVMRQKPIPAQKKANGGGAVSSPTGGCSSQYNLTGLKPGILTCTTPDFFCRSWASAVILTSNRNGSGGRDFLNGPGSYCVGDGSDVSPLHRIASLYGDFIRNEL